MDYRRKSVVYFSGLLASLAMLYMIGRNSLVLAVFPLLGAWLLVIFLTEAVDRWFFGRDFWSRSRREKIDLLFGTVVFCVFLDFFGMFVTRLWYYPPGTPLLYAMLAPPAYYLYGKLMFVFYESAERFFGEEEDRDGNALYRKIMLFEEFAGPLLLVVTALYSVNIVSMPGTNLLSLGQPLGVEIAWWFTPAMLLGFFFVFEHLSYRRDRATLTLNLVNRNFYPLASVLVASFLAILFVELVNAPLDIWKFSAAAWPLSHIQLVEIPLLAYVYWPLQFPAMISLLRAIYPEDSVLW